MLPRSIQELEEYTELTEKQKSAFQNRLYYIEEIAEKIEKWLINDKGESLSYFLEDLELDISVNCVFSCNGNNQNEIVSSWVIHATWIEEENLSRIKSFIGLQAMAFINRDGPKISDSSQQSVEWLKLLSAAIKTELAGFYSSREVDAALAHYYCIDIIIAKSLSVFYILKLL